MNQEEIADIADIAEKYTKEQLYEAYMIRHAAAENLNKSFLREVRTNAELRSENAALRRSYERLNDTYNKIIQKDELWDFMRN